MLTRRAVLAASALVGLAGPVRAQLLNKTVRIIVGFPAGGATDILARILAGTLRGTYAASVIVENKPGGAARVAIDYVKNAEPDGSEFLLTPDFPITVYPHSFRALSYDPLRDLVPVAPAARSTRPRSVPATSRTRHRAAGISFRNPARELSFRVPHI